MNEDNLYVFYIIAGILAVILIVYWAITLRKKEAVVNESWLDVKEALKANKSFFILLALLVFSILTPIIGIVFSKMNIHAVPGALILIPLLIGTVTAIAIIVASFGLFLRARKLEKQIIPKETYLAIILLGIFWFVYASSLMIPVGTGLFLIIMIALGSLVSVKSILHRGKLNKIIGIILLITFLSIFLPSPILDSLKFIGVLPDFEKARSLVKEDVNKAVKECQKYWDYDDQEWCYSWLSNELSGLLCWGGCESVLDEPSTQYIDLCLGDSSLQEWHVCIHGRGYDYMLTYRGERKGYKERFTQIIKNDSQKRQMFCKAMAQRYSQAGSNIEKEYCIN